MNRDLVKGLTARAAAVLALAASIPGVASACSKPWPFAVRDGTDFDFIGTARSDTVRVFTGGPQYYASAGHSGDGRRTRIYGQHVAVDRLSRRARELLGPGVRDVVLVPWDFDASCQPVPWTGSARWSPPGERALYRAVLRRSEDWVDRMPTLDVFDPAMQPYGGPNFDLQTYGYTRGTPRLSPDELLTLIDAEPGAAAEADTVAQFAWLGQLARSTSLHGRFPFSQFAARARWSVQNVRAGAAVREAAGTYRVTLRFETGGRHEILLRSSGDNPDWQYTGEPPTFADGDSSALPTPHYRNVEYVVAREIDGLDRCRGADPVGAGTGEVEWSPTVTSAGTRVWQASMQEELAFAVLGPDAWRLEHDAREAAFRARTPAVAAPESTGYRPKYTLRFERASNGRMLLTGTVALAAFGVMRVEGERISTEEDFQSPRCGRP